jgi:steroid 5-alpha reductase family enzyme
VIYVKETLAKLEQSFQNTSSIRSQIVQIIFSPFVLIILTVIWQLEESQIQASALDGKKCSWAQTIVVVAVVVIIREEEIPTRRYGRD